MPEESYIINRSDVKVHVCTRRNGEGSGHKRSIDFALAINTVKEGDVRLERVPNGGTTLETDDGLEREA